MAQSAADRRRAQRETAARVRRNRELAPSQREYVLPRAVRQQTFQSNVEFANRVLRGDEPMPAMGTPESRVLASVASYASRGLLDPRFETAFSRYWYHFKNAPEVPDDADEVITDEYDDDDEDTDE